MARTRVLFLAGGLLAALALGQEAFSPSRTYTVGDKDVYGLNMKMATSQFDVSMTGKLSYEVKKVHADNGEADIEYKAYDVVANVMGQEVRQPGSDAKTLRYSRSGAAIEKGLPKEQRQPAFMNFLTYRPTATMKVGETVKVEETLDDDNKTQVKGTSKLESMTDGVAKVVSSLDLYIVKGKKPAHIDSISYIDVKSTKLNRAESKMTNTDSIEVPGLPPVSAITVVVERTK